MRHDSKKKTSDLPNGSDHKRINALSQLFRNDTSVMAFDKQSWKRTEAPCWKSACSGHCMRAVSWEDACIDAVDIESHGMTIGAIYDKAKQALMLETVRPNTLRQAIQACRIGGVVSVPGVYGGPIDKFPIGANFAKGLTLRGGQTHVHRYMQPLLDRIRAGEIDPSCVITHRLPLEDATRGYEMFRNKEDQWIKVVMRP